MTTRTLSSSSARTKASSSSTSRPRFWALRVFGAVEHDAHHRPAVQLLVGDVLGRPAWPTAISSIRSSARPARSWAVGRLPGPSGAAAAGAPGGPATLYLGPLARPSGEAPSRRWSRPPGARMGPRRTGLFRRRSATVALGHQRSPVELHGLAAGDGRRRTRRSWGPCTGPAGPWRTAMTPPSSRDGVDGGHDGVHPTAPGLVVQPDDDHVGDAGVLAQGRLDLGREHIDAPVTIMSTRRSAMKGTHPRRASPCPPPRRTRRRCRPCGFTSPT